MSSGLKGPPERNYGVEGETLRAQKTIDVGKEWLVLIERQELDLGMDNEHVAQALHRALQDQ